MATLLSPGIAIQEKDFSGVIPAVSTSVAAIAGRFTKGPIEVPILISSEQQLVNVFGKPSDINANEWWTAAEFLKYSNSIYVTRAKNTGILNATSTGTGVEVINTEQYESFTGQETAGTFVAKNSGDIGNGIEVFIVDATTWASFKSWSDTNKATFAGGVSYADLFFGAPSTSQFAYDRAAAGDKVKDDELHVLIVDKTGKFSGGRPMTVLEKYEGLSKIADATTYTGAANYYVTVLNQQSNYVWWSKHPAYTNGANDLAWGIDMSTATTVGKKLAALNVGGTTYLDATLSGGVEGTTADTANIEAAYLKYANKDLIDINFVLCGAFPTAGLIEKYIAQNISAVRKDCVTFMSPHSSGSEIKDSPSAHETINTFKSTSVALDDITASYCFMDTGFKYIYDTYNRKYRYVPMNGDMAGLAARTDSTNDAWWSFGGFNRGGIKNCMKLAFNPTLSQRDYLYPKGINPVIMDPLSGPTLLGDRTMTTKPSAFDRINVRRLFLILEKAIERAAKYQLFEFNDSFTRSQFKNMVDPFLRRIQGRRGITEFLVVCDESNNTPEVIDTNGFVADLYIKPARSINFITLSFVATRSDVRFSTLIGG